MVRVRRAADVRAPKRSERAFDRCIFVYIYCLWEVEGGLGSRFDVQMELSE